MSLSFSGPDSFYSKDEDAWWQAVDKALKGRSRDSLSSVSVDGFDVLPIYSGRSDTDARVLRENAGDWHIFQRIDHRDVKQANRQVHEDLTGGAGGLELIFGQDGIPAAGANLQGLQSLLDGVELNLIEIRVAGGADTLDVLRSLFSLMDHRQVSPATVGLTLLHDPFTQVNGAYGGVHDDGGLTSGTRALYNECVQNGSPANIMNADGSCWHNRGASQAQELAIVLATAVADLRLMEDAGIPAEEWSSRLSLTLAADADQFGTIAKARAIRKLWAAVLAGADLPQDVAKLNMTTSLRMLTRRDPWVNLLRNTVAAFSAGIGGADSVTVLPHTHAVGLPDEFARRLARNTQTILLEESNLGKVVDPAAGSGAIEDRTDKLCAAAWELFQKIEANGGMAASIGSGLVGSMISETRAKLSKDIARRKRPLTGVSEFPDLAEKSVEVLDEGQGTSRGEDGTWRLSETFEALRDAADCYETVHGRLPRIFLANLGSLAQFTARATWTANAFAAGGISAVGAGPYASHDELVSAFQESGATIACIVSSDAVYQAEGADVAEMLKAAGAAHVFMAGKPGDHEQDYRSAGVDTFVHAGGDILALLQKAHKDLEVQP